MNSAKNSRSSHNDRSYHHITIYNIAVWQCGLVRRLTNSAADEVYKAVRGGATVLTVR